MHRCNNYFFAYSSHLDLCLIRHKQATYAALNLILCLLPAQLNTEGLVRAAAAASAFMRRIKVDEIIAFLRSKSCLSHPPQQHQKQEAQFLSSKRAICSSYMFWYSFFVVRSSFLVWPDSHLHCWEACNQPRKVKVERKREQNKYMAAAHQGSEAILRALRLVEERKTKEGNGISTLPLPLNAAVIFQTSCPLMQVLMLSTFSK